MSGGLFCPGRNTLLHNYFLRDYPEVNLLPILGVDVGSADLLYASKSSKITLCSQELFHLELHKLLTLPPAHQYIRQKWETVFDHGRDWHARGRIFAHYNKAYRRKKFKNWSDVATFYCILAMSSFRFHYQDNKLHAEHCPQCPDYEALRLWAQRHKSRQIIYSRSDILTFNTLDFDNNTLLYMHLPAQYGNYGYGYTWTRQKWLRVYTELESFALSGQRVCISTPGNRWAPTLYESDIDTDVFRPLLYHGLKASHPYSELYYVANF